MIEGRNGTKLGPKSVPNLEPKLVPFFGAFPKWGSIFNRSPIKAGKKNSICRSKVGPFSVPEMGPKTVPHLGPKLGHILFHRRAVLAKKGGLQLAASMEQQRGHYRALFGEAHHVVRDCELGVFST